KKAGGGAENQVLSELGMGGKSNVDNEIEIFKSRSLMERVVKGMQLNVRYYAVGAVHQSELFDKKPFTFHYFPDVKDTVDNKNYDYELVLENNNQLELTRDDKKWKASYGDTLVLPTGKAVIELTTAEPIDHHKFRVIITGQDKIVDKYVRSLTVNAVNKQVSVIVTTLQETHPKRGEAVLNRLIEEYMKANVEDNNMITDSTIAFIDSRLMLVGEELMGIEKEIEGFKKENELTDISEQSKILLNTSDAYVKQLTEKQVQLEIINSLEKYLSDNQNDKKVIPASLVIQSPVLYNIIDKYNDMQAKKERLLVGSTEANPLVENMDVQLETLRGNMKSGIVSMKRDLEINISKLQQYAGNVESKIRQVPAKERVFLEFSRQQNIKQELYLFLLKKREESAISKSSSLANAKMIDSARRENAPFKPVKSFVLLVALLAGLGVPGLALSIKDHLNNKISTRNDITNFTTAPIIGEICHSEGEQMVVVQKNTHTVLAEQFRAMRTNLRFLLPDPEKKVIIFTSSISGEGKSFASTNLSAALALSGKRVVLLEFDMRKPGITKNLNIFSNKGLSSYLVGDLMLSEIVVPSGLVEGLYIIPSGPIPPDPTEIILLPKLNELFEELREQFDYVIVDSPPIGLVTDAQLLADHADASLYMVRLGYTPKHRLPIIHDVYEKRKLPKVNLILNDVKAGPGYGGYGGYYAYYGSNKGEGYFNRGKAKKKGIRAFIRSKFKV
ncbi:MAG TPA: polysaccharide biosynthesis tyrosine autokinase, partial [Flavipsychrobacter sp.]|nr:polysaccharide biosynthesis tyrosine autokinase [Flavipsychrobacter sp.]